MSHKLSLNDYESAFQTLQFRLALKISGRLKLRMLGQFCQLLENRENQVINHSYYQEILSALLEYVTNRNLIYQPTPILQALYKTLTYIQKQPELEKSQEGFKEVLNLLQFRLISSLVCVREFNAALRFACDDKQIDLNGVSASNLDSIDALLSLIKEFNLPDEIIQTFQEIKNLCNSNSQGFSDRKVWIPLVEKFEDTPGEEIVVGTIYPMVLDLEARQNNRYQDIISFNNHPIDQDDLVHYQAQDAILAARNRHNFLKKKATRRYTVMFGFPSTDHLYTGMSFGFGMSLLSLCALARESNLRKQYAVAKNVAITGGIAFSGEIRDVHPGGLEEKIGAAFYSPLRRMILPRVNLEVGQKILDDLQALHPHKKFTLQPETSLSEILTQRDVVSHKKMPFSKWVKNHLTRFQIIKFSLIALLAVSLTLTAISIFTDPNPSEYRVEGERVNVLNNTGKFLWSFDLGHNPESLEHDYPEKSIYRRLQIHDFDGDGENEVILGTAVKKHQFNGRLYFLETDGSLKWSITEHPVLKFGKNEYTNNYAVGFIYPYQHSDSKTYEFYTRFSHMPYYPNRIARIDINGNILDEYVHPGGIYDMELIDLNRDGEMELLIGGTNNGFNDAALTILPSRGYGGTAPAWMDHHNLNDSYVDSNLVYIKFPHWGRYDLSGTNARTHVSDIFPDSKDGFIASVILGDPNKTGSYLYHFDLNLNLVELAISDGFLSLYHQKYGKPFFEVFDQDQWYEQMTHLDIWRNGAWNTPED